MDSLSKQRLLRTLRIQSIASAAPVRRLASLEDSKPQKPERKPKAGDCFSCCYFSINCWDKRTPYCCQMYGFKGPQLPSSVVLGTSGEVCRFYKQKPPAAKNK